MEKKNTKKKKTYKERFDIIHRYNKRTGFYKFLCRNTVKLVLIMAAIILAIVLLQKVVDINVLFDKMVDALPEYLVFVIFLVSESVLGWIPPDLFSIWAKQFHSPYWVVTFLATLSYIGGINAFFLGKLILKHKRVNRFVEEKNKENFALIRKWGGVVIVMAALFPLPYATISTIAGMVHYPFKRFAIFGLTRYLRFYIYAIPIYNAMDKMMNQL